MYITRALAIPFLTSFLLQIHLINCYIALTVDQVPFQSDLHIFIHLIFSTPCEIGIVIVSILQIRENSATVKLRAMIQIQIKWLFTLILTLYFPVLCLLTEMSSQVKYILISGDLHCSSPYGTETRSKVVLFNVVASSHVTHDYLNFS